MQEDQSNCFFNYVPGYSIYLTYRDFRTPDLSVPSLEEADVYSLKLTDKPTEVEKQSASALFERINKKNLTRDSLITLVKKNSLIKQNTIEVIKGISLNPECPTVVLSQGGVPSEKPYGLLMGYSFMRNANFPPNCICITHNPKATRRRFSFGLKNDRIPLEVIQKEILTYQHGPTIHIGDCIGAYKLLKLAADDIHKLDTLILISPYVSVKNFIKQIADSYVAPYLGNVAYPLLNSVFKWYLPNYSDTEDNLEQELEQIKNKKILIIYHVNDKQVNRGQIDTLIGKLKQNNECYLHVSSEETNKNHGAPLLNLPSISNVINAFYKKYKLPCFEEMAIKGEPLLNVAQQMAL